MVAAAAAVTMAACKKDQPITQNADAAPPADEAPALDPELKAALAATSAAAKQPDKQNGPPPSGVFSAEQAALVHDKGAPPNVELGAEGGEPKLTLTGREWKLPASASFIVAVRTGLRSSLPTVELTATLKGERPKADAGAQSWNVTAKIKDAKLAAEQPGQLPPGVDKEVATLKGSELQVVIDPSGAVQDIKLQLAAGANEDLGRAIVGAAETLAAFVVPAPSKPVGPGAVWIARSRMDFGGVDLISYRMYRLTEVDSQGAKVSVEVRQYAVDSQVRMAGLTPDMTLGQVDSLSQGEMRLAAGALMASEGTLSQRLVLGLSKKGEPAGQVMPVMLQTTSTMTTKTR